MPFIIPFNIPPFMEKLPPALLKYSRRQKGQKRRKQGERKEGKNWKGEQRKIHSKRTSHGRSAGKNDSEDYNQIAIDQLGLMQTMIPEENPPPSRHQMKKRKRKKCEKQQQSEEPRKVQRLEVNRTRMIDERKLRNSKETKPSTQRK